MLVSTIRKRIPYNLRRIIACVTHTNETKTQIVRCCNEPNLLPTSVPSITIVRTYSNESDSEMRLPKLIDRDLQTVPSFLGPLKLIFMTAVTIHSIDADFDLMDLYGGVRHAMTVISKALANQDFQSLDGLITENMIEILSAKIETLSPSQRQLIAINEEDIVFSTISDIKITKDRNHSMLEIHTIHQYIPSCKKKIEKPIIQMLSGRIISNYSFVRKYVDEVGGPWIANYVNHASL